MAGWRNGSDIASAAGGLGFDSRADEVSHRVANAAIFFWEFEAAEMGPATRYMLKRNTGCIMGFDLMQQMYKKSYSKMFYAKRLQ